MNATTTTTADMINDYLYFMMQSRRAEQEKNYGVRNWADMKKNDLGKAIVAAGHSEELTEAIKAMFR